MKNASHRYADFQSRVDTLMAQFFKELPKRPLPNLQDDAEPVHAKFMQHLCNHLNLRNCRSPDNCVDTELACCQHSNVCCSGRVFDPKDDLLRDRVIRKANTYSDTDVLIFNLSCTK